MTDLEAAELKKALARLHQSLAIARRWGIDAGDRIELISCLSDAKGKLEAVLAGSETNDAAMGASMIPSIGHVISGEGKLHGSEEGARMVTACWTAGVEHADPPRLEDEGNRADD